MQTETSLPTSQRLSFRILITTIIGLTLTLSTISYTLQLSWQLEGGAGAINEAGSLRMRTYKIATLLAQDPDALIEKQVALEVEQFNQSLRLLERGEPQRPLFLSNDVMVQSAFNDVQSDWHTHIKPLIHPLSKESFLKNTSNFVNKINAMVSLIESDLVKKTTWLRWCQTALIFMALTASVAVLYLLYLWIIGPVMRMQAGIMRMTKDDLSVRLPIENEDEFGKLAQSFNQMADHVQTMHRTLEERVHSKTSKLIDQNKQISTLYDIAGFLSGPHDIEELCRGFLHRIMQRINADGGTVRILDNLNDNLHLTVHEGMSEKMINEEHCIKKEDCFCGTATQQGIILVRDFRQLNQQKFYRCKEEGFFSLAVFQIKTREQILGSFSLHFNVERAITGEEQRLLETLGNNLGAAIENLRSIAKEKELAVSQERNLLAQGLHDSIAQGLNFLNLQVQMLEDSLKRNNIQEIQDIMPLLRAGVQESYEDVRELLLNFRSRIQNSNLESEMRNVVNKFERQTGVHGKIECIGTGAPLAPEQQLQVLFILQEALSNVRKHAQANEVFVKINNEQDFTLMIKDDGIGFSNKLASKKSEEHVGLSIMKERAERMGAKLDITSEENKGTLIYLQLLRQERLVA